MNQNRALDVLLLLPALDKNLISFSNLAIFNSRIAIPLSNDVIAEKIRMCFENEVHKLF